MIKLEIIKSYFFMIIRLKKGRNGVSENLSLSITSRIKILCFSVMKSFIIVLKSVWVYQSNREQF